MRRSQAFESPGCTKWQGRTRHLTALLDLTSLSKKPNQGHFKGLFGFLDVGGWTEVLQQTGVGEGKTIAAAWRKSWKQF